MRVGMWNVNLLRANLCDVHCIAHCILIAAMRVATHSGFSQTDVTFLSEIAAVTVSPVVAVMVTSPVTKSSLVRSPVKELSPVRHFHR